MANITKEDFLALVEKSSLVSQSQLERWIDQHREDDLKRSVRSLVKDKLLTPWQVKRLLRGKYRLTIGSYQLRERLDGNEHGDRFEAIHAQLDRKVLIQILPKSLSEHEEARKRFLRMTRHITELDHPNLVHVYDIEEESGRFFLVSEHTEGESLLDLADRTLNEIEFGRIIRDCLDGLRYAHKQGIERVGIEPEGVIFTAKRSTKIRNLGLVAVRDSLEIEGSIKDAGTDLEALAGIANSIKGNVVPSDADAWADLQSAISGIVSDPDEALLQVNQWTDEHDQSVHASDIDGSLSDVIALSASGGSFDQPLAGSVASTVPRRVKAKKESETEEEPVDQKTGLAGLLERHPIALIASTAIGTLLIAGTAVAIGLVAMGGGSDSDAKQVVAKQEKKQRVAVAKGTVESNPTASLSNPQKPPSNSRGDLPTEALDPEANRRAIEAMFGGNKSADPASSNTGQAARKNKGNPNNKRKKKGIPKASEDVARDADGVPLVPFAPPQAAIDPTAPVNTEPATMTVADVEKPGKSDAPPSNVATATKTPDTKPKTEPKPVAVPKVDPDASPFEKFPALTSLPDATNMSPHKIGDLVLDRRYLLGAELISGEAISKQRVMLSINRSADDKQKWEFFVQKRKKDEPVAVATLQKTPSELLFQWLPAIAENEAGNYLRNCVLKLSTTKDFHYLTLREPVVIENFKLTAENLSPQTEIQIPWNPDPDHIRITVNPIYVKRNKKREGSMEPADIQANAPARMFFQKEADRFMWLSIDADFRNKLKVKSTMLMQPDPGSSPTEVRDIEAAEKVSGQVQAYAQQLQATYQQALTQKAPSGKAGEFKEYKSQLKKQVERSAKMAALGVGYGDIIPQIYDKEIPVTVIFQMDSFRTVLAVSPE